MKMFLTRLGFGSKVVVTGDASQIDLPGSQTSGLSVVENILGDIDDIEFCHLTSADVVRHELVGAIIDAYQATTIKTPRAARAPAATTPHAGSTRHDRGYQRDRLRD